MKFLILFLVIAFTLSGCVTVEREGFKAFSFGQASAEVVLEDGTTVKLESRGLSDNFAVGVVGNLTKALLGFFGRGEPPVVNVNLSAALSSSAEVVE